jgi:uncharacterized membrane protein (UPF0127 family)
LRILSLLFSFFLTAFCRAELLTIQSASANIQLDVELATNNISREKGLMYREVLGSHQGMLFVYPNPQQSYFWMKNTFVPLDMLFLEGNGDIIHIHENAQPHSLKVIPSPKPVKAVLEILGGQSKVLGIRKGDRIQHSVFSTKK